LSLVGNFAERFGLDPDKVFTDSSMGTVIAFAVEDKEKQEFRERYNDIHRGINGYKYYRRFRRLTRQRE